MTSASSAAVGVVDGLDVMDAAGIRRLLAVRVTARPEGVRCELFATSRRGPLRHPLSLPAALALTTSGVHTVVAIC